MEMKKWLASVCVLAGVLWAFGPGALAATVDNVNAGTKEVLLAAIQSAKTDSTETIITITNDISLNSLITIDGGKIITIKSDSTDTKRILNRLCTGNLITVTGSSRLTLSGVIVDGNKGSYGQANGSLVFVDGEGARFVMDDEAVLQNNAMSGQYGGGVYLNGGTFIMTGESVIRGNAANNAGVTTAYGGGVFVNGGTFTMENSTISDNQSGGSGGGVYVGGYASFTMTKSTVSGNTSYVHGGGVYVQGNASFTMSKSTISGNTSGLTGTNQEGGGVYFTGAGDLAIYDSTISGNRSYSDGGGVRFSGNKFTIGGATVIAGNTRNNMAKSNVYLVTGKNITLGTGGFAPTTAMNVGVDAQENTTPRMFIDTGASEAVKSYFFADNGNLGIALSVSGDSLQLAYGYYVSYHPNGSTGGSAPSDTGSPYLNDTTVTVLGNTGSLVKTGHAFGGWNTMPDGNGTTYQAGATFQIMVSTMLYAKWLPAHSVSYDGNGSTGGSAPIDAGSPYALPANVTVLGNTGNLVKTGHTFAGWNTKQDGDGTAYQAGDKFNITSDTTFYAQWFETPPPTDNRTHPAPIEVQPDQRFPVTASGASGEVLIENASGTELPVYINLKDASGQAVRRIDDVVLEAARSVTVKARFSIALSDLAGLAPGTYTLWLASDGDEQNYPIADVKIGELTIELGVPALSGDTRLGVLLGWAHALPPVVNVEGINPGQLTSVTVRVGGGELTHQVAEPGAYVMPVKADFSAAGDYPVTAQAVGQNPVSVGTLTVVDAARYFAGDLAAKLPDDFALTEIAPGVWVGAKYGENRATLAINYTGKGALSGRLVRLRSNPFAPTGKAVQDVPRAQYMKAEVSVDKKKRLALFRFDNVTVDHLRAGAYVFEAEAQAKGSDKGFPPLMLFSMSSYDESLWTIPKTLRAAAGQAYQLVRYDTDARPQLTVKSSNKKVATIDDAGVLTIKRTGTATITVKDATGKIMKCKLTANGNSWSRKKPLYEKGKAGLYSSTKHLYYKGGALKAEVFVYNRTGKKLTAATGWTFELYSGEALIYQRPIDPVTLKKALKHKQYRAYSFSITEAQLPGISAKSFDLATGQVQAVIRGPGVTPLAGGTLGVVQAKALEAQGAGDAEQ